MAVMLWASWALGEETPRVFYQRSEDVSANARIETDHNVIIVTSGRVNGGNDPHVRESALRAQVAANLAASRSLAGSDVVVTSNNGTIVLDGIVAESADLGPAELIARRTPGVVGVVNQLRVEPSVATRAEALDDAQLAERVSERLAAEFARARLERWDDGYGVGTDSMELNVNADNGEVMLSGTVPSYDALGRAVTIAHGVSGVQAVRSNVHIDVDEDASVWESSAGPPFKKPQHHPFFDRSQGDRDD
jgi:osmotically-inducible protein OsmY